MSEQDVMRLVAEVVDKSSGVLKKIQASFKSLGEDAGKAHDVGSKAAREHAKRIAELHERIEKTKDYISDALVPTLATLGITSFGVGEAVGTLADKIKAASEKYQALNDTIKRGHVSSQFVQGMSDAFSRLGMDVSKANDFVAETGETLDKLRRGNAAEMQRLTDTFGNTLPWLEKVVSGARNYQEAAERIMKALTDTRIPIDQRRKLAEAFHIDPRIASKNGEEVGEALSKSMAEAVKHGLNIETLSKLDDAYTELGIRQQQFWNDLINVFGPGAVTVLNQVRDAITPIEKQINSELRDAQAIYRVWVKILDFDDKFSGAVRHGLGLDGQKPEGLKPGQTSPNAFGNWSPAQRLAAGMSPISFTTGGDRNNPLYRGVRDGVLDAFRQLMGEKSGGSAGGFVNASYATGGSYGVGFNSGLAGRFGGYGGGHGTSGGSSGGSDAVPDNAGAGTSGYVNPASGPFDRHRFIKELQSNTALRDKIMRIAANEQGRNAAGTQAVIESMMNRANVRGTSLAAQARWHESEGGYYQQGTMGRGALENPKYRAILERSLAAALHGANTIDYATDNSSGGLADRERATGKFVFHRKINGESFFSPGNAEIGLARRYNDLRQRLLDQDAERSAHGARLSDHIRNHIRSGSGGGHLGHASVSVDFHNMPRGTRTSAKVSGMFKEAKLNRGRPMAMASQDG
ncbi:hypothetical protein ACVW1C_001878 [Bradyrhizobium sp. USDA 4011]